MSKTKGPTSNQDLKRFIDHHEGDLLNSQIHHQGLDLDGNNNNIPNGAGPTNTNSTAIRPIRYVECPVCKEAISRPVYSCEFEHIVCEICLQMTNDKCPVCRVDDLVVVVNNWGSSPHIPNDNNTTEVVNFYEHLECPMCKEFVASPVYSCENGHIICGICEKMNKKYLKCPICRVDLVVNSYVDRVLRIQAGSHPCRNAILGCTLNLKPWEMIEHLFLSCDFRTVKCAYAERCGRLSPFHPKDILKHWIDDHETHNTMVFEIPSLKDSEEGTCDKKMGFIYMPLSLESVVYLGPGKGIQPQAVYFEFDGHTFFTHVRNMDTETETEIHVWLMMLGEESVALGYEYSVIVMNPSKFDEKCSSPNDDVEVQKHKIPVHSMNYCDLKNVEPLGHTLAITTKDLIILTESDETSHLKSELDLNIRFKICSKGDGPMYTRVVQLLENISDDSFDSEDYEDFIEEMEEM